MRNLIPNSLTSLDEFVFSNRNKLYGAYQLRKNYSLNLFKALSISISLSIGVFLVANYLNSYLLNIHPVYKLVDYRTDDFSMQKINIPKITIQKEKIKISTSSLKKKNLPPIVKEIEQPKNESKNSNKIENNNNQDTIINSFESSETNKIASISDDTIGTESYSNEIYMKVDIDAQFPGGEVSFNHFVDSLLVYPTYAKQNQIEGIIFVHILVNVDGKLEEIKIYKGIEESCNEAILQLAKAMPAWIPARKEGMKVRQRLIVPFQLKKQN